MKIVLSFIYGIFLAIGLSVVASAPVEAADVISYSQVFPYLKDGIPQSAHSVDFDFSQNKMWYASDVGSTIAKCKAGDQVICIDAGLFVFALPVNDGIETKSEWAYGKSSFKVVADNHHIDIFGRQMSVRVILGDVLQKLGVKERRVTFTFLFSDEFGLVAYEPQGTGRPYYLMNRCGLFAKEYCNK